MREDEGRPTEHPYKARFIEELNAESVTIADQLDEGFELPFTPELIQRGARRYVYSRALDQATSERRWVLAWLLKRALKQ